MEGTGGDIVNTVRQVFPVFRLVMQPLDRMISGGVRKGLRPSLLLFFRNIPFVYGLQPTRCSKKHSLKISCVFSAATWNFTVKMYMFM